MDFRNFEDPKRKEVRAPRVSHTEWVQTLVKTQSVDNAYKIVRRLAVPMFIYQKESTVNPQAGFYQSALSWLKKHHPYQSKRGAQSTQNNQLKSDRI